MKTLGIFIFLPLFVLLFPTRIVAANPTGTKQVTLIAGEVVDHDYFAAGESVRLSGTVNGDAYLAGGDVTIDGTVNGDLLVAGGSINLDGTVTQNVRIIGGTLMVRGTVGKNLSFAGGNLTTIKSSAISGNLTAGAGNVTIYGPVSGSMTVGTGNATIASRIGGNATVAAGQLMVDATGVVNGNLTYTSERDAMIQPGGTVSGTLTQRPWPKEFSPESREAMNQNAAWAMRQLSLLLRIAFVLSSFLLGMVLIWLFPKFSVDVATRIRTEPLPSFLAGTLLAIGLPLLSGLLLLTVVGIPLAFAGFLAWGLYLYLSHLFVALALGNILISRLSSQRNVLAEFLAGLLVYHLISFIPFWGSFLLMLFGIAAIGAFFYQKRILVKTLREQKIA